MTRQLTAQEKRRITGTNNAQAQTTEFARLCIPATPRNPAGRHVIECVANISQVRPHFTALQWAVIRDEHIGTGLVSNRKRGTCERSGQHQKDVHQHDAGTAQLLHSPDAARKEAHQ